MLDLKILSSAEELRRVGQAWDELWDRSDAPLPTLRAETLLLWLEDFAPTSRFRALVVFDGPKMLAALPLIDLEICRMLGIGSLPKNSWSISGDLMIDSQIDPASVMSLLAGGLRQMPWPLLLMRRIEIDRPVWREFLSSVERNGLKVTRCGPYDVGLIRFPEDSQAYLDGCAKRHVKNMERVGRRADETGGHALQVHETIQPDDVEPLLREGFEIESRSWKRRVGSAVLQNPLIWRHYLRQAKLLAAANHLYLVFLEHAGNRIAFEYSYMSKGWYITPKAGYDEDYRHLSPSQLLCYDLYRHLADQENSPVVDLFGPLNDAERCWITEQYHVETVLIALKPLRGLIMSRALLGLRTLKNAVRRRKRV